MRTRAVVAACVLSVSAVPALPDTIEVVRTFSVPGSTYTFPQGINSRGDIVTFADVGGQSRTWTYLNRKWTALPAGQGAQGINERQQMAGSNTQYGTSQGSILNGSRVTLFHPEDAVWTIATGINNLGHVAGGYGTGVLPVSQTTGHGYVYADGTFTTLEFPGALGTTAHSLNDRGDVVGYYSYDTPIPHWVDRTKTVHGFVYRQGEWEEIDYPGAATTYALGINNRGDVVGFYFEANAARTSHAFVKTARGYFPLAFQSSWTLAYGINDLGQIVGCYWENGVQKGFLAVIRRDDD
jgi:uncharacterized membrane protein